jgi:hypothetical protein
MRILLRTLKTIALLLTSVPVMGQNLLQNGGFEQPVMPLGTFQYGLTNSGWRFSPGGSHGGSGITTVGSLFTYSQSVSDGQQMAFLQADGNTISQTFTIPGSGKYELSYFHAGRSVIGGNLTYSVLIDTNAIGTFSTTTSQSFSKISLQFDTTAGQHTITFVGVATAGSGFDQTAFFDAVKLVPVLSLTPIGFSAGKPLVGFTTEDGRSYTVQARFNADTGLWATVLQVPAGAAG